jgi:hypothetical protein
MLLVLLQSFSKLVIMAEFRANQDRITRTLCVNRNKPLMKCHGHCQLMKRLAAEEKSARDGVKMKQEEIPYPISSWRPFSFVEDQPALNDQYHFFCNDPEAPSFFHPPSTEMQLSKRIS